MTVLTTIGPAQFPVYCTFVSFGPPVEVNSVSEAMEC